ncbi:MAG: RluA family pseudouridine synthase [Thermodesulfobacteriota bacterium]
MNETFSFIVSGKEQGQRLDRFLADRAGDLSRARIKDLIEQGHCEVDCRKGKAGRRVRAGQRVELRVPETAPPGLEPEPGVTFGILYQDSDLIVIDKPPGLVVHPAAGHHSGTLVHGLLAACPDLAGVGGEARPGIVHRLDKDTSGVMVAAKNDRAHRALVAAFKSRHVRKVYLALCRDRLPALVGEINAPVGRHPVRRKEMSVRSPRGRPALTRYRVLERFPAGAALVWLEILTGRTHQIRVHLASLGCPVLGDSVYGSGPAGLKKGGGPFRDLIRRQMLHSHRLEFDHPVEGRALAFQSPPPPDMARVIEVLAAGKDFFQDP